MRSFLASNTKLKVLALVFALALWFFVAGQSRTEVGFLVPLGFKGIPKDMVMTSMPPDELEVRVTGPKLFINNLSPTQITAEIDLSGAREGLNTYRIQSKDIITPMGVEVQRLRPSSIEVKLEKMVRAELPVKARLTGRPAAGYRVADVAVAPTTVSVTGTEKEMRKLKEISTRPIDISGIDAPLSVKVQLDHAGLELRSLSVESVEVRILPRKER
ncbi:MAG: hypothetical protein HS130_10035 [Deltaproteobacteria bacterium]|nr:hypothetical protein [Deltaproteobacteria bacterium]MCL4874062.1 hypothetical protein [bacterium]